MLPLQRYQHNLMGLADQVCCQICLRCSSSCMDTSDVRSFTEVIDCQCCAYGKMGLSKPDKVALMNVSAFKPGNNLSKWMESIWTCILLHQGSVALQQWVHKINYLDNGIGP